ncbi:MAG: hypothetical protein V4629_03185 [Pseudomonadota bacterium]
MKIGFLGVLFLIFLTLKLCDVIAWSWWWVTAPLWGGFVLVAVIFGILGIVKVCLTILEKKRS